MRFMACFPLFCSFITVTPLIFLLLFTSSQVVAQTPPPQGYYQVIVGDHRTLVKCPDCIAGKEPYPPCQSILYSRTEAVCKPCALGYFKSHTGFSMCRKCGECARNQMVEKLCTATQNQHCGKCAKGYVLSPDGVECLLCCKCVGGHTKKRSTCNSIEDCPEMCTGTTATPQHSVYVTPRDISSPHFVPTSVARPLLKGRKDNSWRIITIIFIAVAGLFVGLGLLIWCCCKEIPCKLCRRTSAMRDKIRQCCGDRTVSDDDHQQVAYSSNRNSGEPVDDEVVEGGVRPYLRPHSSSAFMRQKSSERAVLRSSSH